MYRKNLIISNFGTSEKTHYALTALWTLFLEYPVVAPTVFP
jgi:hypothetical protein